MQRLTHSPPSYASRSGPVAADVFEPPPQQRMFLSLRSPCFNAGILGVGCGHQSRCGMDAYRVVRLGGKRPRCRVSWTALPLAGSVGLGLELQCECRYAY
jgi:hypothetical protein